MSRGEKRLTDLLSFMVVLSLICSLSVFPYIQYTKFLINSIYRMRWTPKFGPGMKLISHL